MMTIFPLTDCCTILEVDPKTLRTWLKHAQLPLHSHPTDSRIKCLTLEQIHHLSAVHHRPLVSSEAPAPAVPELSLSEHTPDAHLKQAQVSLAPAAVDLQVRLSQMETQITSIQQHLAQLTLELLQERTGRDEQRLSNLEAFMQAITGQSLSPHTIPEEKVHPLSDEKPVPFRRLHPGEVRARSRVLPLVEYGADGTYVLICPQEGELSFFPDSPQWFEWLASLSSFRFLGKEGRFTAYRNGTSLHPSRTWSAQRYIHPHKYKQYLGVTDAVTLARLEHAAAQLQSYVNPL